MGGAQTLLLSRTVTRHPSDLMRLELHQTSHHSPRSIFFEQYTSLISKMSDKAATDTPVEEVFESIMKQDSECRWFICTLAANKSNLVTTATGSSWS